MRIPVGCKVVTSRARHALPLQAILSRLEAAPTDWRRKILRLYAHPSILRLAQGSAERVGRIIIRPYKNLAMIMISPCDRHDKRKIPRSARNGKKGSHQQDWWATLVMRLLRLKVLAMTTRIPPAILRPSTSSGCSGQGLVGYPVFCWARRPRPYKRPILFLMNG
jgi:hypothetical protein